MESDLPQSSKPRKNMPKSKQAQQQATELISYSSEEDDRDRMKQLQMPSQTNVNKLKQKDKKIEQINIPKMNEQKSDHKQSKQNMATHGHDHIKKIETIPIPKDVEDQLRLQAQLENQGQLNPYFHEQAQDEQIQMSAVYDENQIKNITQNKIEDLAQESLYGLNQGVLQKQTMQICQQMVQDKILLVLWLLFRKQIYKIVPRQKYHRIDIHPANRNKIRIYGSNKQQIKEVSIKISQIIDSISVVKLNIKPDEAMKMKHSKLLGKTLVKQQLVIFRYGFGNQKHYYLGGKGSQPVISSIFKQIRNFKFRYFRVFPYQNTRSYKIILNYIVQRKQFIKYFAKYHAKSFQLVDYVPNFAPHSNFENKKQKQKCLCFLLTSTQNVATFSPKQIGNQIVPFVKNTFYSLVLIFRQGQKHLPKLMVDKITFKYISQRKFNRTYLYILCTKNQFLQKREEIIKQIQKIEQKNKIYGARYFKSLSPQQSEYLKPDNYKKVGYPTDKPYSFSIMPKRIIQEGEPQNKITEGKDKEEQKREWKFYEFDWKQHLRGIHATQISFLDEVKL